MVLDNATVVTSEAAPSAMTVAPNGGDAGGGKGGVPGAGVVVVQPGMPTLWLEPAGIARMFGGDAGGGGALS